VTWRSCVLVGLRRIDRIEGQKSFNGNFDRGDALRVLRCLVAFIREFES
jgi:hypothetical protein